MLAASLFLLFQSAASSHTSPALRLDAPMQFPAPAAIDVERDGTTTDLERETKIQAAYEDRELVKRLNTLLSLLHEFAASYNAGKIDVKTINQVRKALHDLEKSAWFKPSKTN
jgi:hypothetical protein